MIAKNLIQADLPTIRLNDSSEYALSILSEFKLSHLAVVQNDQYFGIISEDELLENEFIKVSEHKTLLTEIYAKAENHIYDVLKLVCENHLSLIPVLNEKENYLGSISIEILAQQFSKLASLQNAGGILVLELNTNDYSMAEVARIVEANDAKILSSYITSHTDSTKLDLTIKLNQTDLTRVIKALTRFDYVIKASFHESEFIDELKDRYDNFMHYLNI